MDAVTFYANSLYRQGLTTGKEDFAIYDNTKIASVDILEDGELQFLFVTSTPHGPICQYAIFTKGEFNFRDNLRWFTPGDFLFETFTEALDFLKAGKK